MGKSKISKIRNKFRSFIGKLNKTDVVQFGLRKMLLPFKIKHLHGPLKIGGTDDDVIVISVMRNSMTWLKAFLTYHRNMGILHFAIIDNGSTDGTVETLLQQPDVTLLQTHAPYHAYENTMKRYLAERFCRKRWCLCVDADEQFDFPGSSKMTLASLIRYLRGCGYNAVITQMLDMFSEGAISEANINSEDALLKQCPYYDLTAIDKTTYPFGKLPNEAIRMHFGGIRKMAFGTNNGLTKVSLFFMGGAIKPFIAWHHASNARLADISCVLLHFPFERSFGLKIAEAVASGRYGYGTTNEYQSYLKGFQPQLTLKRESSRRLQSVDELLDSSFLVDSMNYRRWCSENLTDKGK